MSTIKREKRARPFTIIDNAFLQNGNLTPAAMGVFAHLMSLKDDYVVTVAYLQKFYKSVGKDYISTALKCLEKYGYLERVESREKGKFKVDYILYEIPKNRSGKTATANTLTGAEKPERKNRHGSSLYIRNLDKSKLKDKERESEKTTLETPSLDSILELSTQLKIDETVATKFYHFYKLKGFTQEMINNLEDALSLWNSREFKQPPTKNKNDLGEKWGAFLND